MYDPLETLRAEARYHRQRLDLYRAKMYGPQLTSATRLRELQRSCESAEARLAAAKRDADLTMPSHQENGETRARR